MQPREHSLKPSSPALPCSAPPKNSGTIAMQPQRRSRARDRLVASGFRIAQQHFVGTNSLKESWGLPLLLEPPKGGRMKAECRMQNTEPAPQVPQTLRLKPTSWDRLQTAPRPTPDCLQITPGMQKNENSRRRHPMAGVRPGFSEAHSGLDAGASKRSNGANAEQREQTNLIQ